MPDELHVWKGAKVKFYLKTSDVLHSFYLPNLRLKQDALPGKTIPVWFEATDSNTRKNEQARRWEQEKDKVWEIACAELCGGRHYAMRGKLYVHPDKDDYLAWPKKARQDQQRRFVLFRKGLYATRIISIFGSTELVSNESQLQGMLAAYGIKHVLIADETKQHHPSEEVLRELLRTSQFKLMSKFPITGNGRVHYLLLYENQAASGPTQTELRLPMMTLNHDIVVPLRALGIQ